MQGSAIAFTYPDYNYYVAILTQTLTISAKVVASPWTSVSGINVNKIWLCDCIIVLWLDPSKGSRGATTEAPSNLKVNMLRNLTSLSVSSVTVVYIRNL
jgi:hypothetical protein